MPAGRALQDVALAVVYFGRDVPRGVAVCRTIRKHPSGQELPILAILEAGAAADYPTETPAGDVLILPASEEEASLRVRLALWRTEDAGGEAILKAGDVVIDSVAMHVREKGIPVELTFKEFSLLAFFVQNQGIALARDSILAAVWGDDYFGGDRTVDIHVRRLRAKLPTIEARIETIHGIGYRFAEAPEHAAAGE